jgi:hypothetical protein
MTPINAGNFFRTVDTTKYGGQKRGPNGIGGGDGFVDQGELKALTMDKSASGTDQKAASWLLKNDGKNFNKYDDNHDGRLSTEEATKAIADYNKSRIDSQKRQNAPVKPAEVAPSGDQEPMPPKHSGNGNGSSFAI